MIVPRPRLVLFAGAVAAPLAGAAWAFPGTQWFCVPSLLVLTAVAVADAWMSMHILDGLVLEAPGVIRATAGRHTRIPVRIRHGRPDALEIRLAPGIPAGLTDPGSDIAFTVPPAARIEAEWSFLAATRGRFRVDSCAVEAPSRLGLWSIRGVRQVPFEVRVYPDMRRAAAPAEALFLARGLYGSRPRRQVGRGREFEHLREFVRGDSRDDIHWKATARRGVPIVKTWQIERTQEVYACIDVSRLGGRPSEPSPDEERVPGGLTVLDRWITAALVLGRAAQAQGDLFGLMAFSGGIRRFVRARNGAAHYGLCRDAIFALEPHGEGPSFEEVCTFLDLRLRRRSLLVFLTDLSDPSAADSFKRGVELIRRRHIVMVGALQPPFVRPVFSPPDPASVDGIYRALAGHLLWARLKELQQTLSRTGVTLMPLSEASLAAEVVSRYLEVKRRQLL